MGSGRAGMPAGTGRRGAGGLALFARGRLAAQAIEPRGELRMTPNFTRDAIAQRMGNAAPTQRGREIDQRDRSHAEAALIGIVADAEIEFAHAVLVKGG